MGLETECPLGYGRMATKEKGFNPGVELIRTDQYGDIWFLRVRLSRADYRMKNLKVTSLEEAQEMVLGAWQSMMRDIENKETFKQSLTLLLHPFSRALIAKICCFSPITTGTF